MKTIRYGMGELVIAWAAVETIALYCPVLSYPIAALIVILLAIL